MIVWDKSAYFSGAIIEVDISLLYGRIRRSECDDFCPKHYRKATRKEIFTFKGMTASCGEYYYSSKLLKKLLKMLRWRKKEFLVPDTLYSYPAQIKTKEHIYLVAPVEIPPEECIKKEAK